MTASDKPLVKVRRSTRVLWRLMFAAPEGRVLAAGITLTILGLVIILVTAGWSPETSRMMGAMALTNITFGRAVSMSIGYAAGFGHALVIPVNMVVETILVLLFYPLFVFSLKKLVVIPALRNMVARAHQAAVQHEDKVRRYGIIGLFVFVWFPFWMTGPVIGSAIGYLLAFPVWLNLTVVLAGTYIAMVAWAYLLFHLQAQAADLGSWAPALIIMILVAVGLIGYWLNRKRIHDDGK